MHLVGERRLVVVAEQAHILRHPATRLRECLDDPERDAIVCGENRRGPPGGLFDLGAHSPVARADFVGAVADPELDGIGRQQRQDVAKAALPVARHRVFRFAGEKEQAPVPRRKQGSRRQHATIVIAGIENAIVVGGLSAIGAALYSIGIPKDSVIQYETALKADSFLVMAHGTAEEMARAKTILCTGNASRVDVHAGAKVKEPAGQLVDAGS